MAQFENSSKLQVLNSKQVIAFGEIIWDILPSGRVMGGAPANFAIRMQSLGHRVTLVSRVGQDGLGAEALLQLKTRGVDIGSVAVDEKFPTGTAQVQIQPDGSPVFSIIPNVAYDYITRTPELSEAVRAADFFCFGSLVQRSDISRATLRALLADTTGIRVLDLNLRPACFTPECVPESLAFADILKLNLQEAHYIKAVLGWPQLDEMQMAQELVRKFELEVCLITLGGQGVIAAQQGLDPVNVPGFSVEVIDTCGSGDGFTAAFLDAYSRGESLYDACRKGNAMGALVAATPGATTPISSQQLQDLLLASDPS